MTGRSLSMSSLVPSRVRILNVLAPLLTAAWLSACCHCKPCCMLEGCQGDPEHPVPGKVIAAADAQANPNHTPPDNGANPKVFGRTRFQGSIVAFDVMSYESNPAQVEKLVVNWTSHPAGSTPIPWPAYEPPEAPLHEYTISVPKTRWYVVDIAAACDPSGPNNCFHIRVEAYDHAGNKVFGKARAYAVGLDTEWEELTEPL